MAERDLIVIGGSAGALEPVTQILQGLPRDLPASVLVVIHTAPDSLGMLASLLDRAGPLSAVTARNRQKIVRGNIYVAPPDCHMLVRDGRIQLTRGPKENGFRPAIDPLFRTTAAYCGPCTIGIVVSGGLDDGTQGLIDISTRGGITIAQDPLEATFPSMPQSAIDKARVDHVLRAAEMPAMLVKLIAEAPVTAQSAGVHNHLRPDVAEEGSAAAQSNAGPPSGFTCPECGGALWEISNGDLTRYRCHVGHGYTAESLSNGQGEVVEAALWSAVRVLEEQAALCQKMATRSHHRWPGLATHYVQKAKEAELRSSMLRAVLLKPADGSPRRVKRIAEPVDSGPDALRHQGKDGQRRKPGHDGAKRRRKSAVK